MNTRISILTPSFNAVATIERAIQSVQMQGYDEVEHIIVDGASTDGTVDILKRYPQLRWISEPDRGQSDAMNKAIRMASGDVMTFLNADDEFFSGAFTSAIRCLQNSLQSDIVIGRYERRHATFSTIVEPKLTPECAVGGIGDWPTNPVAYFYRKELQNRIGFFPVTTHYAMDYWWMLRALNVATPVYVNEVFGCFHSYGNNKTSDRTKSNRDCQRVLLRFLLSPRGIRHVPTWIKTRYWRYLYLQKRKSERVGPKSESFDR